MLKRILLIEDDAHVSAFVKKGLEENSFSVQVAASGEEGLSLFEQKSFDLVLLDIMLPGISGLEVCARMRTYSQVPILMLTALGAAENTVLGLNTGADDYLAKPFKFIELTARIRSLLRRSEANEHEQSAVFSFESLLINDDRKAVTFNGNSLSLTSTEYRLLLYLVRNARRVLSRADIIQDVWGIDFEPGTNVVDVYINYLRRKLEKAGAGKLIHTITGMGYVLKSEA